MKKIYFFLAALTAMSLAACSGQNEPTNSEDSTTPKVVTKTLKGRFSVAENHTVRFAQGNLQYNGGAWQFANEQFIYYGYGNDGGWEAHAHDLFFFGQTGYSKSLMTGVTQDLENAGGYNPSTKSRENIDGTNWDWGVFCSISNGGNHPGLWRTLTYDEWYYLLHERRNADKLYMPARVAGKRGYLLLPDNWSCPIGIEKPDPEGTFFVEEQNTYCYEDWLRLENAGAVFLPCAGVQNHWNTPYMPEFAGYYWTSTVGDMMDTKQNTIALTFGYRMSDTKWMSISFDNTVPWYYRCAVRLVQEID